MIRFACELLYKMIFTSLVIRLISVRILDIVAQKVNKSLKNWEVYKELKKLEKEKKTKKKHLKKHYAKLRESYSTSKNKDKKENKSETYLLNLLKKNTKKLNTQD